MSFFHEQNEMDALARGVAQRRISLNLTQAELAKRAGISKRTLERLENGLAVETPKLLAVLFRLEVLDGILRQIPGEGASPVQQVRALRQGKPRQRVRKAVRADAVKEPLGEWVWGDEK